MLGEMYSLYFVGSFSVAGGLCKYRESNSELTAAERKSAKKSVLQLFFLR